LALTFHPVSARVNTVRNDDASLIEPVAAAADAAVPDAAQAVDDDDAPDSATPAQKDLF